METSTKPTGTIMEQQEETKMVVVLPTYEDLSNMEPKELMQVKLRVDDYERTIRRILVNKLQR